MRIADCTTESRPMQSESPDVVACMERMRRDVPHASAVRATSSPSRPTGALEIRSFPEGAALELDGEYVGEAPVVLPQVESGTHHIRARWPGGVATTLDETVRAAGSVTARLYHPFRP
jgi:hypothetical protein